MKNTLMIMTAGLLTACGATGDLSLFLYSPEVITEYRTITNQFVGCDVVNGLPDPSTAQQTQVRVNFNATGKLEQANVRLGGAMNTSYDNNFLAVVNRSNTAGFRETGNNTYSVLFTADTTNGLFLPSSLPNPKGISPQGITVTPTVRTVKIVTVNDAFRSGTGFYAYVEGISLTGQRTGEVRQLGSPVTTYSQCTVSHDTGINLRDY